MTGLLIGEVTRRTGVAPPTIRYYESIGLLKAAARSESGYRRYTETSVEELLFIRKAQALGFSLDEIGEILHLSRTGKAPCSHVLTLAHQHLAAVDERIRQLRAFRHQLATDLARWDRRETAITCSGLCQFIADAEPKVSNVALHLDGRRPRQRSRKACR